MFINEIKTALKEYVVDKLNRRFGEIENNHIMAVSTILDPRFIKFNFKDTLAGARAISY